ncbi:DNA cytosine methyltransferase [Clostridium sp. VAP23]|uniref:DNA cytosine methyltransferase n=1 Tax=Clostridium sp. VAP23 TaxID=2949981 RepID=UPI002079CDEC|nr:DNA cytosine methyltransferase [Clostridium sp. VAP23]
MFSDKSIKKRLLETKNHRIYLQDTELLKTEFKPGKKYNFEFIKKDNSKLRIYIDDNGRQKVSKREKQNYINPVIDIRNKDVLDKFSKFDKIEIEILKNEILVSGSFCINDKTRNADKNIVVNFYDLVKKKEKIAICKKSINDLFLQKVSSSSTYEQLNFESILSQIECSEISISHTYNVNKKEYKKDITTVLRFVSLFSGAGIMDKGFIDEGFKPRLAIELEKDMVKTYKANLGNHVIQADLSNYDLSRIPDAEILIGGSPCQDLSNENRITGKIIDSPKNLLIRKYIEVAEKMKSLKVFVLENVTQLLTKGKKFVDEIKQRLSDFEITIHKVNTKDFGTPQSRERTIIIGSKIGKIELSPPKLKLLKTVRQAFSGLTDNIPNQQDYSKAKESTKFKMSFVPEGGNLNDIPKKYRGKGTHSNSYRRLEWDKPSITIINPRKANILHPDINKQRILSVRECARLFDLPDDFIFYGNLSNKQQMICNSVPVNLSKAIAKAIKNKFLKSDLMTRI